MRMHGMPDDLCFLAHFAEEQTVCLIGLGMGGYSVLALGNAIPDYIRGTATPNPDSMCCSIIHPGNVHIVAAAIATSSVAHTDSTAPHAAKVLKQKQVKKPFGQTRVADSRSTT
jgi:hypothetical protein